MEYSSPGFGLDLIQTWSYTWAWIWKKKPTQTQTFILNLQLKLLFRRQTFAAAALLCDPGLAASLHRLRPLWVFLYVLHRFLCEPAPLGQAVPQKLSRCPSIFEPSTIFPTFSAHFLNDSPIFVGIQMGKKALLRRAFRVGV